MRKWARVTRKVLISGYYAAHAQVSMCYPQCFDIRLLQYMAYAQESTCYPQSFDIRILRGICASEHMLPEKFWYQDITPHMRKWAHFTSKVLISVYYAAYAQVSTCYLKSFSIRIFCGKCASEHMLPAKFLISGYCTTRYWICASEHLLPAKFVILWYYAAYAQVSTCGIYLPAKFLILDDYVTYAQCARDLM